MFFISLFLAIFAYKKEQSWHWVAVGLLTDFCLRFYVSRGGAGLEWAGAGPEWWCAPAACPND